MANLNFDAAIVGYPKCGNTWTQLMVRRALVKAHGLRDDWLARILAPREALPTGVPAVEVTHNIPGVHSIPAAETTIDNSVFAGRRVVLLVRHPADMLVSMFMHIVHREPTPLFHGTCDDMVTCPINGLEKYLLYYRAWDRDFTLPDNVLLLRYEDLRADPWPWTRTLLGFLDLPTDVGFVDDVVAFGSFQNMRRLEESGGLGLPTLAPSTHRNPRSYKVREGKVGGGAEHLTPRSMALIEAALQRLMPLRYGYGPTRAEAMAPTACST